MNWIKEKWQEIINSLKGIVDDPDSVINQRNNKEINEFEDLIKK